MGKRRFIPRKKWNQLKKQAKQSQLEPNNKDPNHVINLSHCIIHPDTLSLLHRGLSFCPTPKPTHRMELHADCNIFFRKLRLAYHFMNNDTNSEATRDPDSFKSKSTSYWTPPSTNRLLDSYINVTEKDILDNHNNKHINNNLCTEEQNALNTLRKRKDITIKSADKGGAIVIMDTTAYTQEALRQLNNRKHYIPIPRDATNTVALALQELMVHWDNNNTSPTKIPKRIFTTLTPAKCRTAAFYLLPKIHKPGNPGRPIISANECPTELISNYVDHHINKYVKDMPTYLRDTKHLLNKLADLTDLPTGSILVTIDVCALYTSIPHADGLTALRKTLEDRPSLYPPTEFLLELTQFILQNNVFEFNGKFYRQVQGTAMGTRMAPSYANLFMQEFENSHILRDRSPFLHTLWRYIDDILAIWTGTEPDLIMFLEELNNKHPTIKFTWEYSKNKINFLDTTIYMEAGKPQTTLFTKPTDAHLYLQYSSCHPRRMKNSIPYSQLIRIKRICSNPTDYELQAKIMLDHFTKRGYPKPILNEAAKKAAEILRPTLLLQFTRNNNQKVLPFVTQFNPSTPNIGGILHKNTDLLRIHESTKPLLENRFLVAYKRPPNLKDILCHSRQTPTQPPKPPGSHPCGGNRCGICKHFLQKNSVISKTTGKKYPTSGHFNCNTNNLVYLIQCTQCGMQYVGETKTSLRLRFNNHKSTIARNTELPVARHFNLPNLVSINGTLMRLQIIHSKDDNRRKRTEEAWIQSLRTYKPQGINHREG